MAMTKREQALDAAITVVGTQGVRALSHVRVDEKAGLPKGSTSNYFRTRAALLAAVVDRIVELELRDVGQAMTPASAAEFIDGLCFLIDDVTDGNRVLTTARLALFVEGSHDDELQKGLSRGRAAMEKSVVYALARLGAPNPIAGAAAVMACCEGTILHRIARGDDTDPRPMFELIVKAALQ